LAAFALVRFSCSNLVEVSIESCHSHSELRQYARFSPLEIVVKGASMAMLYPSPSSIFLPLPELSSFPFALLSRTVLLWTSSWEGLYLRFLVLFGGFSSYFLRPPAQFEIST
jgi:hypothetical protein